MLTMEFKYVVKENCMTLKNTRFKVLKISLGIFILTSLYFKYIYE